MLEICGAVLGLIYIFLEYRASIHLWVVGSIMPIVYAIVYFQADLFAQAGIQLYYVAAAIYGWWQWYRWNRREAVNETKEKPITRISLKALAGCVSLGLFLAIPIYFVLQPFSDTSIAITDALITALSVVAMLMLAMKIAEQWLVWLLVDIICVMLYLYLSFNTDTPLFATAALYAIYSILAVVGYLKWRTMAVTHKPNQS